MSDKSTDTQHESPEKRPPRDGEIDAPYVVGLGASAEGLEALQTFFEALPDDPDMIFIVAQHLAPDYESELDSILQNSSKMPVQEASDGMVLVSNNVYVIPPGKEISVADGQLRLDDLPRTEGRRAVIDFLFRSLAEHRGDRAVGILFSGAGTDGTTGLRIIKEHGGVTLAQSPDEAGVTAMPRNAIRAGVVDFVMPAADLAERVAQFPSQRRTLGPLVAPDEIDDHEAEWLERIVALIREATGTDMSSYKRPTMLRRIGRRMQIRQVDSLAAYHTYLEENRAELDELFGEMLIGVTNFFRNPDTWEALYDRVIPKLFEGKKANDTVRVWVPGCSTGEEAYTIALLMTEYADSITAPPEVKIFATDIDSDAIDFARRATYPSAIAADVPDELLHRYFRIEDDHYQLVKTVRRKVMFAVQNVLTDPPFSHLELVSCRNLLIYLIPEAQERLLELLHYALSSDGYLMLGESETTTQYPELYEEVDEAHRIYRSVSDDVTPASRVRPAFRFEPTRFEPADLDTFEGPTHNNVESIHRDALIERYAPPSILVDDDYVLRHVLGDVRPYLSVRPGKATGDILKMLGDEVRPHVRTLLFEAFRSEGEPVQRRLEMGDGSVDVEATRLRADLVELAFEVPGSPRQREISDDLDAEDREVVDQLEQELEDTRERLQSTIYEYESTNEKLRASNEELMSMNEELQSTTEELQTSKEELQSMNEEMTTVNEELNDKIDKLDAANSDLRNLLRATNIGTVFLDRNLQIKRYTDPVTEYVNMIPSDEGRPFDHVTHSLDTDKLLGDARRAMQEPTTIEREVSSKDGDRHFLVRTMPYLDIEDRIEGAVLTFIDITDRKRSEEALTQSEQKFRTFFNEAADAMFVYSVRGVDPAPFDEVNRAAVEQVGVSRKELQTMTIGDVLGGPEFDLDTHLATLREAGEARDRATLHVFGEAPSIPVDVHARRIEFDDDVVIVELVRHVDEDSDGDEP
jgi:two-component system CheB/CheR fusion protein